MSRTPCACPCAVSTTSASTCAFTSASARSIVSLAMPIAAAAPQATQRVLRRVRVLHGLLDVLDRDQPFQPVVAIDDEQLFDLVLVKDLARRIERRADRHRDELFVCHDIGDWTRDIGLEPEIAIRQDADQPPFLAAVLGDRDAGDAEPLHQFERFVDAIGRARG